MVAISILHSLRPGDGKRSKDRFSQSACLLALIGLMAGLVHQISFVYKYELVVIGSANHAHA
jgi:hypothetical protein